MYLLMYGSETCMRREPRIWLVQINKLSAVIVVKKNEWISELARVSSVSVSNKLGHVEMVQTHDKNGCR